MKIAMFRWIDRVIGALLIFPLWIFSFLFPKPRGKPRRILIIKLWALGESLLVLPLIRAVRKKHPRARIDVLCRDRVRAVFEGQKTVNGLLSAEPARIPGLFSRFRSYDLVFDCEPYLNLSSLFSWWLGRRRIGFDHGVRSLLYTDRIRYNDRQHIVLTYMDLGRPLGVWERPERLIPICVGSEDEKYVDCLFKESGIKDGDLLVAVCPGVAESSRSRIWPARRFAKVADALVREFLAKIIITGTKAEIGFAQEIARNMEYQPVSFAGQTSVRQLAALIKRCSLVIAPDSGSMHLAAAMGVPTIGLFCPNTPVRWAPYGPGNDYVYKPILPRPCINTHLGQLPDCKNHKHMSLIKSIDVIEKARRLLYARRH